MLDLYARSFDDEPLGEDDYVLSADEKPGVQARHRIHRSAPPGPGRRPMRVESEYRRHGTLAYLAAYDVHHARVIGHCAPTTGIAPFTALVTAVMTREPYASARRVFWIVDNGASHRSWTAAARLSEAFPNAIMVHTPVHASWLNQIEIYFSDRPAETAHPRRRRQPRRARRTAHHLRSPLQHRRPTLRLAIQPQRPRPTPQPDRRLNPRRTNGRDHSSAITITVRLLPYESVLTCQSERRWASAALRERSRSRVNVHSVAGLRGRVSPARPLPVPQPAPLDLAAVQRPAACS